MFGEQLVGPLHGRRDQVPQRVDGLQQDRRQRRGQHHRAGAQTVEHVLDAVRELGQRREAEPGGVALDRVRGPEDRLQRLFVLGRGLELDEGQLHLAEVLFRLRTEDLQQLGAIEVIGSITGSVPTPRRRASGRSTCGRARPRRPRR